MAIAMTVGATKIRLLQESSLASMQEKPQEGEPASSPEDSCST
jgi:hypothetical protein